MSSRQFPNLFIIGAMKAGTSSLHEYLRQHPEIYMSRFKEPQYFAPHNTRWGQKWGQGNPYPEPGMDWYLRLFDEAGDVKYAGESSVSYSARPWVCDCEQRIYEFNPASRIIYLLRNPVERAISHYWHFVADGREDRDMLSAMERREEYVARSDYAMQLKPYLECFGREQVYVLTVEELIADPSGQFRRLFNWLGVNPDVYIDIDEMHNVGGEEYRQTRRGMVLFDTIQKHWKWQRVSQLFPKSFNDICSFVTHRRVNRRQTDMGTTRQYLQEVLHNPTQKLRRLLNREFSEWNAESHCSDGGPVRASMRPGAIRE